MDELKKIAAEMRECWRDASMILRWADALDALAAQSQEPVAWMDKWEKDYIIEASQFLPTADDAGHYVPLYAAPQPAPPQPAPPQSAVPEEFERALERFSVSVNRRTYGLDSEAALAEARAEVLRLYALASAGAVKVPDGWKLVPVYPTRAMLDAGFTAFNEEYLSKAAACYRAMLNAAPEAGS